MSNSHTVRIGTRGSRLALAQTNTVIDRLKEAHPHLAEPGAIKLVVITTTGDRVQDVVLAQLGGKGLFTKELDEAMIDGRIDIAIHSMKDVPTFLPEGLLLHAILGREDVRDAFISKKAASLGELPPGATIGTASLRRKSQVLAKRSDITVVPFRGNVDTRLKKLEAGEVDATILACAGLNRLGRADLITHPIDTETILPAVGQGALAATCREGDKQANTLLAVLGDSATTAAITAERAMLAVLDGSCHTPIAGLAEVDDTGVLTLRGLLAAPGGERIEETMGSGPAEEAERIGRRAAEELLFKAGPEMLEMIRDGQSEMIKPHPEMNSEGP